MELESNLETRYGISNLNILRGKWRERIDVSHFANYPITWQMYPKEILFALHRIPVSEFLEWVHSMTPLKKPTLYPRLNGERAYFPRDDPQFHDYDLDKEEYQKGLDEILLETCYEPRPWTGRNYEEFKKKILMARYGTDDLEGLKEKWKFYRDKDLRYYERYFIEGILPEEVFIYYIYHDLDENSKSMLVTTVTPNEPVRHAAVTRGAHSVDLRQSDFRPTLKKIVVFDRVDPDDHDWIFDDPEINEGHFYWNHT